MKWLSRALCCAVVLAAGTAAGRAGRPSEPNDDGVDLWSVGKYRAQMRTSELVEREVEKKGATVRRRIELRRQVLNDLLAGRIGPEEAGGLFAELTRADPAVADAVRAQFPGRTDEDRAAWQLLAHWRAHLRVHPDKGSARLADEWERTLLARN